MSGFRRTVMAAGSACLTLLLHALLLSAVIWGGRGAHLPRMPEAIGAAANAGSQTGSSGERMILIQLTPELSQDHDLAEVARLDARVLEVTLLQITGPDALPPQPLFAAEAGEEIQASDADLIARTQLAGLYEGQIRARIERAWVRPRDPLPEGAFACRARVHQDATGTVIGVEFDQCNGTARWQKSLLTAVYAASPLPAPPSQAVFVDAFSLGFQAAAFQADAPNEGYEEPGVLLASIAEPNRAAQVDPQSPTGRRENTQGIVYLNGANDSITWSTQAPTPASMQGLNPTP